MIEDRALSTHSHTPAERILRITGEDVALRALTERLVDVSLAGLPEMYDSGLRSFAYTRVKTPDGGTRLAGESQRYGAIVLLGACFLDEEDQRPLFGGETASEFCGRLIDATPASQNLGDVALVAWAGAQLAHPSVDCAFARMLELCDQAAGGYTVELAWALSALATRAPQADVKAAATQIFERLLSAYTAEAGVFAHTFGSVKRDPVRAHVACFADQVYPIQALSRYAKHFGDQAALDAASACGDRICAEQGDAGQWWWHYDARNGKVVEGYPVYSVHQDSMGPMALLDLAEAGGPDHAESIRLGLRWMETAAEIGQSLIDDERGVIWRKVGRTDPAKLVRGARAVASRVNRNLRVGALDALFPATRVDWESRPYHLGWVIHTWLGRT